MLNRWIRGMFLIGLAACAACTASRETGAGVNIPESQYAHPALEIPAAWYVRAETHGMTERAGKVELNGKAFALPAAASPRIAGVWYPRHGLLHTVQADGVVDLYRVKGETCELIGRRSPDVASRNAAVHFTMVPGLVYVLNYDVAKEEELNRGNTRQQLYADVYTRVMLTSVAEQWHGVARGDKPGGLLECVYLPDWRNGRLYFSPTKSIDLPLEHTVAEPHRSGPGESLAQSVFMLANHQIVMLAADGWSLHDATGKQVRFFPFPHAGIRWWSGPRLRGDKVEVTLRTGPGGTRYELDPVLGMRAVGG